MFLLVCVRLSNSLSFESILFRLSYSVVFTTSPLFSIVGLSTVSSYGAPAHPTSQPEPQPLAHWLLHPVQPLRHVFWQFVIHPPVQFPPQLLEHPEQTFLQFPLHERLQLFMHACMVAAFASTCLSVVSSASSFSKRFCKSVKIVADILPVLAETILLCLTAIMSPPHYNLTHNGLSSVRKGYPHIVLSLQCTGGNSLSARTSCNECRRISRLRQVLHRRSSLGSTGISDLAA